MAKNDGGPAFPQISELGDIAATSAGMTLRDWFAGQALAEVMSSVSGVTLPRGATQKMVFTAIAEQAFEIADAMLAGREKGGAE